MPSLPLSLPTVAAALATPKSPPPVVQGTLPNAASSQVASPAPAGSPWPPPRGPHAAVPSPQLRVTGCRFMTAPWLSPERFTVRVNVTLLTLELAGTLPAMSNCRSVRRAKSSVVVPLKRNSQAPELLSVKSSPEPGSTPSAIVLSRLGRIVTVAAEASPPMRARQPTRAKSSARATVRGVIQSLLYRCRRARHVPALLPASGGPWRVGSRPGVTLTATEMSFPPRSWGTPPRLKVSMRRVARGGRAS